MVAEGRAVRVLVVEDNPEMLALVRRGLARQGFEVSGCPDGASAMQSFANEMPDLVVLDLLLPDADGIDLCYQMQAIRDTPIIMLTSRDSVSDRVDGLRAGADDYVVKPFAMEELVARIEVVLRRRPPNPTQLEYEDLLIDTSSHRVLRGGNEVALTQKEFLFLITLAQRPDRVFTREVLSSTLWPETGRIDDNLLDVHAANLRQKLEAEGGRRLIQTVRGIGFVLR
jgi:two-component system response regulator MprA